MKRSDLPSQRQLGQMVFGEAYLQVPKELARLLGMDKATVGEHLIRAEKNVFDKLFS